MEKEALDRLVNLFHTVNYLVRAERPFRDFVRFQLLVLVFSCYYTVVCVDFYDTKPCIIDGQKTTLTGHRPVKTFYYSSLYFYFIFLLKIKLTV